MQYLSTILNDDFLWNTITTFIGGKVRHGTGDFQLKINCPMCVSRGTTPDHRYRCGIAHTAGVGVNCFNCGFKTRYVVGEPFSQSLESFLVNIGVPAREIKLLRLRAYEFASFAKHTTIEQTVVEQPSYPTVDLPRGSRSLNAWEAANCNDPNYRAVIDYLLRRGDAVVTASTYYWTPEPSRGLNRKLLIPCLHDGQLVGWVARSIDADDRKYYKEIPRHFLFNSKFLHTVGRKYIFVVEGVFDALVTDGVAALGATLSAQQIGWIKQSGKIPVVIPDRDATGARLIEIALQQNWHVAIPNFGRHYWWNPGVKDIDEAVLEHGKLFALQSVIACMTNNRQIIKQRMKYTIQERR